MHIPQEKRQLAIIGGVIALVVIGVAAFLLTGGGLFSGTKAQEVSTADPINVVLDFYDPWLIAAQATSTDPFHAGLADAGILSPELRKKIKDAEDAEVDPVLCQSKVPAQISARPVYIGEAEGEVLVMSTEKGWTERAVVTLMHQNGGWYLADIECSLGEFAPEREFSFEEEGRLLKSVEPPLDPQYWHLVFSQNGEQGHVAPLFFDASSICVSADGQEVACVPSEFTETVPASVRGEMTERGVNVKRIELGEFE